MSVLTGVLALVDRRLALHQTMTICPNGDLSCLFYVAFQWTLTLTTFVINPSNNGSREGAVDRSKQQDDRNENVGNHDHKMMSTKKARKKK